MTDIQCESWTDRLKPLGGKALLTHIEISFWGLGKDPGDLRSRHGKRVAVRQVPLLTPCVEELSVTKRAVIHLLLRFIVLPAAHIAHFTRKQAAVAGGVRSATVVA